MYHEHDILTFDDAPPERDTLGRGTRHEQAPELDAHAHDCSCDRCDATRPEWLRRALAGRLTGAGFSNRG